MNQNKELVKIIKAYDALVNGIDEQATNDNDRAYGGIIRAGKGKLVENIAQNLVIIAWNNIGGHEGRLAFSSNSIPRKIPVPINKNYLSNIKNTQVKKYIENNIDKYVYKIGSDRHVFIDEKFVLAIECKSYTENAMYKRIMVDFQLLKSQFPDLNFILLQLESQLTGDYSQLNDIELGSYSTHTITSYFDVYPHIITLLKGERKVNRPIHKPEYFKELSLDSLQKAVHIIENILKSYV